MAESSQRKRTLYLSKGWMRVLFVYYIFILVSSLLIVFFVIFCDSAQYLRSSSANEKLAFFGSIGMALMGASIFYIRKLYKLCFSDELITSNVSDEFAIRALGSTVYFIMRPIFSVGFAVLVVLGLRSGMVAVSGHPIELNATFVHISMFFSFFVGFLSGRFVKYLESKGEYVMTSLLGKSSD